jgi:Zn-dependent protease
VTREEIVQRVLYVIVLVLSLSVHEWAHAYSAFKLGDNTAERQGRLTLNPMAHIDPIGSILLPLLGIPFGWAKPVPVSPAKFSRKVTMKTGMAITAFAGPLSNFVLAILSAIGLGIVIRLRMHLPNGGDDGTGRESPFVMFFVVATQLNVSLGLFNLLPVPPLDGSRLLERAIVYRYPKAWEFIEQNGRYGLLIAFGVGGYLLRGPIGAITELLYRITASIAGA